VPMRIRQLEELDASMADGPECTAGGECKAEGEKATVECTAEGEKRGAAAAMRLQAQRAFEERRFRITEATAEAAVLLQVTVLSRQLGFGFEQCLSRTR
jgi:hypothetical protein